MINKSDQELISQYQQGQKEALDFLISRYLKPIYGFIYYQVKSQEQAEDLTQEVFLKVWKNFKKFNPEKKFKTWLFIIAKNTVIDYWRQKKDKTFSDFDTEDGGNIILDTLADESPLPEEIFDQKDLAEKIDNLLDELTPKEKSLLLLRYKQGFSLTEIAEIFSESVETIKSRHYRSLLKLKQKLLLKA